MTSCRVWFKDRRGVEHGVYVKAINRYHAFGLALHQMKRCAWSNPDYAGVERMMLEVLERSVAVSRVSVTRVEFEEWIERKQTNQQEERSRLYVRMLLGRDPPDRDYKRLAVR